MAKNFNAEKAVQLYKGGMKLSDIAVEMGYERGQGQNRTRAALVKAGVYEKGRKAAGPVPVASAGNNKAQATAAAANGGTNPELLMQECYNVVASRYKLLRGRARTGWLEKLVGMLVAGMGAERAQKIEPVKLPNGLKLIRKAAA